MRSTTQGYLLLTEKLKNDLVIEYQWLALAGYFEKKKMFGDWVTDDADILNVAALLAVI